MKDKITPEKQIEDSKTIIKAVLELDVHNDMKRKVIDLMLWNITGAYGKYKLSYISVAAKDNPKLKINHEHVFRKKTMIDRIMQEPNKVENILEEAIGCVVTVEEHTRLREIEKVNKDVDGWERYKLAQIKVLDIKNNTELVF